MCISKVFQNYFTDTFCENNLKIIETKKKFKIKEGKVLHVDMKCS